MSVYGFRAVLYGAGAASVAEVYGVEPYISLPAPKLEQSTCIATPKTSCSTSNCKF